MIFGGGARGRRGRSGGLAGGVSGELYRFTVTNWDGASSSPGLISTSIVGQRGDVMGAVDVRRVDDTAVRWSIGNIHKWDDGSLHRADLHVIDTDFSSSESRTYKVVAGQGSQFDSPSAIPNSDPDAAETWIAANTDLKLEETSRSLDTTGSIANHTFSLNTALGTATRVTRTINDSVVTLFEVWQVENETTRCHEICRWDVRIYWDTNWSVLDMQYRPCRERGWYHDDPFGNGAVDKERIEYTATLKDGTTTVQSYGAVYHPYYSVKGFSYLTDNHAHGRMHSLNGQPTLWWYIPRTQDKDYWHTAGVMPPFKQGDTWDAVPTSADTVVFDQSSGASFLNHRTYIPGTGGYNGQGIVPDFDARAWLNPTPGQMRSIRASNHAGLDIPKHYRNPLSRTRPASSRNHDDDGATADVYGGFLVPKVLKNNSDVTGGGFTSYGLPPSRHSWLTGAFVTGANQDADYVITNASGGTGTWGGVNDAAHSVAYSYFTGLIEADPTMQRATISLATATLLTGTSGSTGIVPIYPTTLFAARSNVVAAGLHSWVADAWAPVPHQGQVRSVAWTLSQTALTYMFCETGKGLNELWNNIIVNIGEYYKVSIDYLNQSEVNIGFCHGMGFESPMTLPFQHNYLGMAIYFLWNIRRDSNLKIAADTFMNFTTKIVEGHPGRANFYYAGYRPEEPDTATDWTTGDNCFDAPWYMDDNTTWSAANDTFTVNQPLSVDADLNEIHIANGDEVYVIPYGSSFSAQALVGGVSAGQKYYIINYNSGTLTGQLSLTPGGSAIDITSDATTPSVVVYPSAMDGTGYAINKGTSSNNHLAQAQGILRLAKYYGYTGADQAISDWDAVVAMTFGNFTTWRLTETPAIPE